MSIASNSAPNFIGSFYDARSDGVHLASAHNLHAHSDNSQWQNNQIGIFMEAQNQQRYNLPYGNIPRSRSADARMAYEGMNNVHFAGNPSSSINGSVHGSYATVAEDDLLSQNSGSFETTQSSRSQPLSPMDSGAHYPIYTGSTSENGGHYHNIHNPNNTLPQSYYYPNIQPISNFENTSVGPPPPLPYFQREKQNLASSSNDQLAMLNDHTSNHLGNAHFANNIGVHPAYHEAQQQQMSNHGSKDHPAPMTYESNLSSLASPTSINANTTPIASFYGTIPTNTFNQNDTLSTTH